MAPIVIAKSGGDPDLPAKLTTQVIVCSVIAAFGGLMFGYDIGISGMYCQPYQLSYIYIYIYIYIYFKEYLDTVC